MIVVEPTFLNAPTVGGTLILSLSLGSVAVEVLGADVLTLGPGAVRQHNIPGHLAADSGDVLPDAAHAHAPLHLDVAILAPPWAPAVLHQPVVLAILVAVTHNSDGMVLRVGGAA